MDLFGCSMAKEIEILKNKVKKCIDYDAATMVSIDDLKNILNKISVDLSDIQVKVEQLSNKIKKDK